MSPTPDLTPLLQPRSLAVIGASSNAHGLRGRIMQVLGRHAFAGEIFPVSRSEAEVGGRKAYASIAEVPGPVDLAIVIVPAPFVPDALEDCGRAGVRAAQVISSGFAEEPGGTGRALQDRLVEIARRWGMVVTGPNSEGFANPRLKLCPTFSPAVDIDEPLYPEHAKLGRVAVVAQSGGIGFSFFDRARERDLPFSYILTTGNEACLDCTDALDWMIADGESDVFILFVERIGDGARFRRVAQRALAAGKPVIAVKIGRSEAGARAALSHTAAIVGSHAAFAAIAGRHGIVEAADIDEAVELAAGFAAWRGRPAGRRIGIFTGSGGAGGWMADACAAAGLEVPPLDAATRAEIDRHLPPYGSSANPVDATAQAVAKLGYAGLIGAVAAAPGIDAVVAIASARTPARLERDAAALRACAGTVGKPVAFWSYTQPDRRSVRVLAEAGFPLFTSLRNCARALAAFDRLAARRAAPAAEPAALPAPAPLPAGRVLCEYEAKPLLAACGIAVPAEALAASAEAAEAAFERLGGPVALKLQSPDLPHKTEHGLVLLGLADPAAVRQGCETLLARARAAAPAAEVHGVLVQPMAPAGLELIVGVTVDATFGPLLTVGLGGIFAEVLRDTVTLPLPLDDGEVRRALARLRGWPLLAGVRGRPPADLAALADLLLRLAGFAEANRDRLAELDLNPVLLHEAGRGYTLVDALLRTA